MTEVGRFGVPEHFGGVFIEGDEMGVVGGDEDAVADDGDAAIGPGTDGARGDGTAPVPELTAGAGVEGEALILNLAVRPHDPA